MLIKIVSDTPIGVLTIKNIVECFKSAEQPEILLAELVENFNSYIDKTVTLGEGGEFLAVVNID